MSASSFFRGRGLTSVAGRTYPGTFAIVRRDSFFAEQVASRDSATWKKAEHIVVEEVQDDNGSSIIPRWCMLTSAEPFGLSIQKLYVAVSSGCYALYDSSGACKGIGALNDLVK